MNEKDQGARVAPLTAGADGQDLPQSGYDAVVTAAQRTEKPLTAQRNRAVDFLAGFGIGPRYTLSHTEAVNAMQLFARSEIERLRAAAAPASPRHENTENKDDQAARVDRVPKSDHGDLPRKNLNEPASIALTAADVYQVMVWWEQLPASEQQTAIITKLGQLRDVLIRRGDSPFVEAFTLRAAPVKSQNEQAWEDLAADGGLPESQFRPLPPEQVQLLAWATTNCHMLARRALARSTSVYDREKWEHVLRICEKAGARSQGVLRAALPTEITDGEVTPPASPPEPEQ